jgi:anaerobic magnesium-protoporphyrin IX monomethyl ester cyclase
MKILLINPPSGIENPLLPLGLAYIAAVLEKNNIPVDVLDADALRMTNKDIEKTILELKPEIIGITMMTATFYISQKIIKLIKEVLPESLIIAGGAHPSSLPKQTLKSIPEIDIIVREEGEITFLELIKALKEKKPLNNVKGICYKENKDIVCTPPQSPIENLDSIPFPLREKFPLEKYKTHPPYGRKNPYMHLITSRGCPFNCAFCSKAVFGKRLRTRSAKNVVDEVEYLVEKYGVKEIKFYDDDFTIDMKRAEEICQEIIKRKINIVWSCTTRVNLINESLLKIMKKSGCWLISYGVESASQELLNSIRKGITIKQIKQAFSWTRKAGIRTLAYFMVGLPGETRKTIEESIQFAKELEPDFTNWSLTTIFPATDLKEMVKEKVKNKGQIIHYASNTQDMYRLNWDQEPLFIYEENIPIDELKKYITRAYREFYFRPKYIFLQLMKVRSFSEIIYYFKAFISTLTTLYG